jgi:hypothetical protein
MPGCRWEMCSVKLLCSLHIEITDKQGDDVLWYIQKATWASKMLTTHSYSTVGIAAGAACLLPFYSLHVCMCATCCKAIHRVIAFYRAP